MIQKQGEMPASNSCFLVFRSSTVAQTPTLVLDRYLLPLRLLCHRSAHASGADAVRFHVDWNHVYTRSPPENTGMRPAVILLTPPSPG